MLPSILHNPAFYATLLTIDLAYAAAAQEARCPFCGGLLHFARYERKPRAPISLGQEYCVRQSLCCAVEGCRRRTTPRSVLYLGRRVYLGAIVVLAAALAHGLTARRVRALRETLDVDRRTLERWRRWWRESMPKTAFWRDKRSRFMPPVEESSLPQSLVARYTVNTIDGFSSLLRLLSPLSEGQR